MHEIGKMLMIFGGLIFAVGLLLLMGSKIPWLGRLPGDIVVHRRSFHFYFPITTSIILSIILTLILNLFRR